MAEILDIIYRTANLVPTKRQEMTENKEHGGSKHNKKERNKLGN